MKIGIKCNIGSEWGHCVHIFDIKLQYPFSVLGSYLFLHFFSVLRIMFIFISALLLFTNVTTLEQESFINSSTRVKFGPKLTKGTLTVLVLNSSVSSAADTKSIIVDLGLWSGKL